MSKSRSSTESTLARLSISDIDPLALVPITTLGRGSYGKVVLAQVKTPASADDGCNGPHDGYVAVKIVSKARIKTKNQLEKAKAELEVMRTASKTSPFLLHSLGAYQTDDCLLYVMPYSAGGELFFHLQREGRFSESRTRVMAMQIHLGLEHLHAHGIIYRDLKPENVLISNEGRCQLADFGLAKFLPKVKLAESDEGKLSAAKKKKGLFRSLFRRSKAAIPGEEEKTYKGLIWGTTKTKCGTPAYQAPEIILSRDHSLEADWWSFGVLVYELLVGEPPFFAETVRDVYDLILANKPTFPKRISETAKNLISQLLISEPTYRLGYGPSGAADVASHSFFTATSNEMKSTQKTVASWEEVRKLETSPVVYLSESGIVGSPEDAVFFHSDFTTLDVREYIAPPKAIFSVDGFSSVPAETLEAFVSRVPVPVISKLGNIQLQNDSKVNKDAL